VSEISKDDVRAAVAAGAISEQQAARLLTIAHSRHGYRTNMTDEDEPFEFFRGFSEIFVTVGLCLLFAGVIALSVLFGNFLMIPLVGALFAWFMSEYFARKRRMSLPSIALACIFAMNATMFVGTMFLDRNDAPDAGDLLTISAIGLILMLVYFLRFRLPFSTFIMGVFGIGVVFSVASLFDPALIGTAFVGGVFDPGRAFFDLGSASGAPLATLIFGILAFLVAMSFDLRDPHRVSRYSASAFWLHVLAAPALVNTIALSLYNMGGSTGYALTALALVGVTLLAIVIDRRSFLTAGLIYMGLLLGWALNTSGADGAGVSTLLIIGAFVTALGTWWAQIRAVVMRAIPNFPLKDRLPPYVETL